MPRAILWGFRRRLSRNRVSLRYVVCHPQEFRGLDPVAAALLRQSWRKFMTWLTTSTGKEHRATKNNRGSRSAWYWKVETYNMEIFRGATCMAYRLIALAFLIRLKAGVSPVSVANPWNAPPRLLTDKECYSPTAKRWTVAMSWEESYLYWSTYDSPSFWRK